MFVKRRYKLVFTNSYQSRNNNNNSNEYHFINRLSEDGVNVLTFVYEMFKNDKDFPVLALKSIGERVCIPLFRECSSSLLLEFFVLKISDVMSIMEAKLARVK